MNSLVNNYIADELAHKVKALTQALQKSDNIIAKLELENKILKDILTNLMSIKKEDLDLKLEDTNDRYCAI